MNAERQVPFWMQEFARLEPQIKRALARSGDTHDVEHVLEGVATGHFHLWPGERSVIVTEFVDYPKLRAIHFFLGAGDLEELCEIEQKVLEWAKTQGCSRATGTGRRGFERIGRERGWTPKWYVMYREL